MRNKIFVGSIIALCLLLVAPTIPAVNYNAAVESYKSNIINNKELVVDTLERRFAAIDNLFFQKQIKTIDFNVLKQKISNVLIRDNIDWEINPFALFLSAIFFVLTMGTIALKISLPYIVFALFVFVIFKLFQGEEI